VAIFAIAVAATIFRGRFQSKVRALQVQLDNDAFNKGIAAAQQIQAGANPETIGVIPATTQQYSASLEDAQLDSPMPNAPTTSLASPLRFQVLARYLL